VPLRGDDLINVQMVRRVAVALNQVADALEAGALVTVDLFRTRIRVLPIHR
jgi:hypothetical protein